MIFLPKGEYNISCVCPEIFTRHIDKQFDNVYNIKSLINAPRRVNHSTKSVEVVFQEILCKHYDYKSLCLSDKSSYNSTIMTRMIWQLCPFWSFLFPCDNSVNGFGKFLENSNSCLVLIHDTVYNT